MPDPRDFARALRRNATPEERLLWTQLSRMRPRWTRQYRVHPFVGDFACRRARVLVELDGGQHNESAHDRARDAELGEERWRVLRFWNNDVTGNLEGVVAAIITATEERLPEGEAFRFVNPRPARRRGEKK